jgi:hypothetical protein
VIGHEYNEEGECSDVQAQAQSTEKPKPSPSPQSHVQSFKGPRARASGPSMHEPIYLFIFTIFGAKKKLKLAIYNKILLKSANTT